MELEIKDTFSFSGLDRKTGLYEKSQGGTETMYRKLFQKVDNDLLNNFQIICSRVRDIEEDKIPLLWLHDLWNDPENRHLEDLEKRKRFDKFIFVSNQQFQTYQMAYGLPYRDSIVMRNAVDPIEEHQKPDTNEQVNLIYHTTPHRGLNILVAIFVELLKVFPNLHLDVYSSFDIYGWKERDNEYRQIFDFCEKHEQIDYHGSRPNDEIREALKKAHIFAYPSTWQETSCISAIEAMTAGCAVVAPDLAALPETLGHYGYIYRWSENVQEHASRFGSMLASLIRHYDTDGVKMNLANQKIYADAVFSWERRQKEWEFFLNQILEEKNAEQKEKEESGNGS